MADVKQLLQEIAKFPDYDLLPLPTKLCQELNIKTTPIESLDIKSYFNSYKQSQLANYDSLEIRQSDGIIREFKPLEEKKLIICKPEEVDTILSQISSETHAQPDQTQDIPKESSDSKPQE